MTDQVLNILKFILLGLLYLFFARVLWAVWSEVRPPKQRPVGPQVNPRTTTPAPPAAAAGTPARGSAKPKKARRASKDERRRATRLVVLEPKHRRGLTVPLEGEITLGRDDGCIISIVDDSYVSQFHLRFYDHEGQPMLEDLGSTNGTFHNGNKVTGSKLVHPGDRIQVGTTVIEAQ
ncbi:MAG: FHA domain-containing protein [Acidimicrobiia bacterium]|nr:FHA domain-containing protein [Acidimicrobiia bacterium]